MHGSLNDKHQRFERKLCGAAARCGVPQHRCGGKDGNSTGYPARSVPSYPSRRPSKGWTEGSLGSMEGLSSRGLFQIRCLGDTHNGQIMQNVIAHSKAFVRDATEHVDEGRARGKGQGCYHREISCCCPPPPPPHTFAKTQMASCGGTAFCGSDFTWSAVVDMQSIAQLRTRKPRGCGTEQS